MEHWKLFKDDYIKRIKFFNVLMRNIILCESMGMEKRRKSKLNEEEICEKDIRNSQKDAELYW